MVVAKRLGQELRRLDEKRIYNRMGHMVCNKYGFRTCSSVTIEALRISNGIGH